MVNIRLAMIGRRPRPAFPRLSEGTSAKVAHRRQVYLHDAHKPVSCPVYQRSELPPTTRVEGPALIQEHGTTTLLFDRDACTVAPSGELTIAVAGAR